jgi:hypothetical protein
MANPSNWEMAQAGIDKIETVMLDPFSKSLILF